MAASTTRPPSRGLDRRWDLVACALLLLYFAGRLLYFALQIHPSVPPDEVTHLGRCLVYSRATFLPIDSPDTHQWGVLARQPYLYYLLMGKLLALQPFSLSNLVFLRLVNAALGFLTAVYAVRWIALVTDHPVVRVLTVALLTNLLMFTGISAAVNYDNLTNLMAAVSLFHLFRFFMDHDPVDLAAFALAALCGCLTKNAFLPLAFLMGVALVVRERRGLLALPGRLAASDPGPSAPTRPWKLGLLCALAAIAFAGNLALYGGNLARYGRLVPDAAQVLGLESALQNRIFARNHIFKEFRRGHLSYREAAAMASKITQPGDRGATLFLLQRARNAEALEAGLMNPIHYVGAWTTMMVEWIVGYTGHSSLRKTTAQLLPYFGLLLFSFLVFVRKFRWSDADGLLGWAALIAFSYAMILMWLVNYPNYARSGVMWLGTQGRYLFPVLIPICGLIAYYAIAFLPRRIQLPVAILVGAWFLYGDLPVFLMGATADWFISGGS